MTTENIMEVKATLTEKQADYINAKMTEIESATGWRVSEKALDWASKNEGFAKLNIGEAAAARTAFDVYSTKEPKIAAEKGLSGYVSLRQWQEKQKAMAARSKPRGLTM